MTVGISEKREVRSVGSATPPLAKLLDPFPKNYEFEPEKTQQEEKGKTDHSQTSLAPLFRFISPNDQQCLVYLTIISLIVRLAFLNHPGVVVFDEVHFGGFAQKYLNREFFTDLHPPLARLLVTLSAWIGQFDARFSFYDIGADYLKPAVPYITMRAFTAICGAAVSPIAYTTMRAMGVSYETAVAVATMLIFENALTTQSRLILLDAYLVLFTSLIALSWVLFQSQRAKPFSPGWKASLGGLGVSLALTASCKWVGLFAYVAVGLFTAVDLWKILGDVKVPMRVVYKHFLWRAGALILVPLAIYMSTFWVHFALLQKFTPSAASMSLEFQQTLQGGEIPSTVADVYFGSRVRLRQYRDEGPFLHSHVHVYPEGSKQQQVTGYHHRDPNNLWVIRRPFVVDETYVVEAPDELDELKTLFHGDMIRLEHVQTERFLHSHPVDPPISNKEKQHEVSCYGHHPSKFSDLNDNWRIEIVDSNGFSITEESHYWDTTIKPPVLAIGTRFRLAHANLGCHLHCRNKPLPEWGYKQGEVTCGRETLRRNQIWIIESNEHPLVDSASARTISMPKKSFLGRFWEINVRMWESNQRLPADHPFSSRPESWPFLTRGLGFWNGNHVPVTEKQHLEREKKKSGQGEVGPESGSSQEEEAAALLADESELSERARLAEEYNKYKGQQIYLLGNPVLWWSITASLALFFASVVLFRLAKRRNFRIVARIEACSLGRQFAFGSFAGFMFIQWLWHVVPFVGMRRQLFLHHYLPALYFGALLFAILIDTALATASEGLCLSDRRSRQLRVAVLSVYVAAAIIVFYKLAPLAYGLSMTRGQCVSLRWLPKWDFDCNSLTDPVSSLIVTGSHS